MDKDKVSWVATLSDGSTVVEHTGEYTEIPGERKPWVRLCRYAAESNLYLTSLRLNIKGRTIHMPRANFDRFGLNEKSVAPLFYSLQYIVEADVTGAIIDQTFFVDLIAEYPQYSIHYIQNVSDGDTSWIVVTQGSHHAESSPPSPSPN